MKLADLREAARNGINKAKKTKIGGFLFDAPDDVQFTRVDPTDHDDVPELIWPKNHQPSLEHMKAAPYNALHDPKDDK